MCPTTRFNSWCLSTPYFQRSSNHGRARSGRRPHPSDGLRTAAGQCRQAVRTMGTELRPPSLRSFSCRNFVTSGATGRPGTQPARPRHCYACAGGRSRYREWLLAVCDITLTPAEPQDVYDYQMSASPVYESTSRVGWGDMNVDAVGWRLFLEHTVGIYNKRLAKEYGHNLERQG